MWDLKKRGLLFLFMILFPLMTTSGESTLSADEALDHLKKGNQRFEENKRTYPNQNQARRMSTSEDGQHPFATVIACSDSRVPVEELFDVGIGDVFTIRVAGNVVDTDEAGSIEYGVDHLKTPLFVVLGHSGCGAVTAVCKDAELHGNIPGLVDNIIPAVQKAKEQHGNGFSKELLKSAVEQNVWQSIEDLLASSHISLELVKSGKLKIVGAVYHLEDGHIEWLGKHPNESALINNSSTHEKEYASSTLEINTEQIPDNEYKVDYIQSNKSDNSSLWIYLILALLITAIYFLLINKNTALKLNLKGKILSIAFSIILLLIMVAGSNFYFFKIIDDKIESISSEDVVLTEYTSEIQKNILQQELVNQKILTLAHDGVYKNIEEIRSLENEFNNLSDKIDNHLKESIELCSVVLNTENDQIQLTEFNHLINQYIKFDKDHEFFEAHSASLFLVVNQSKLKEVERLEHNIEAQGEVLAVKASEILENIEKFTANSSKVALAQGNKAINSNIIIALLAIAVGILLGLIISNKIAVQLGGEPEEVEDIANLMAQGDLAFDLTKYQGRSGAMKSMINMTHKLKEIVSNIMNGANNISAASQQMSSASQQISSGVSEQASSAEEVSSSMEQMTANIQQNTENSLKTRDISIKASNAIEQVSAASEDSLKAVNNIYSKINIVVEIAEKTDLLAINAAVEAARAGDQGRGFAVVAAEVRKLAERSQEAANEIVALAESGMKLTEESTAMLKEIVPDIQATSRLIEEISSSSREQDAGANQVNSAIQQLSMVTQQNASASEEMASNSEELAAQAKELEDITNHFVIERNSTRRVNKRLDLPSTNQMRNENHQSQNMNNQQSEIQQSNIDLSIFENDLKNYDRM